ncbi:MAG: hypothetical protein V9G08_05175 [Dermatophilaceae bacterium]
MVGSLTRHRDYGSCRLYVDASEAATVREVLTAAQGWEFDRWSTSTIGAITIDVQRNPDRDPQRNPEDFLRWPVTVEVVSPPRAPQGSVVAAVSGMVCALWERKLRVVAACDFEDRLPWAGGIARLRPPGAPIAPS